MRRVLLFMMTTIDGYFEGPNGEIDWHNVDEEFNEFALAQLDEVDTLLFGRVTYEMMAGYWPTSQALRDDPVVAGKMNSRQKIVFSRTLAEVAWENTRLVHTDAVAEIRKLKAEPGKDIIIFGSSDLASSLLPQGLLDEARIMVNPRVLGRGKPLFAGINDRLSLRLLGTRSFRSGNVLLTYGPEQQ